MEKVFTICIDLDFNRYFSWGSIFVSFFLGAIFGAYIAGLLKF